MTGNVKSNFHSLSFIISSLILLFISYIRVTRGLDLTDEMQYYGEIKGLIDSGTLFSNDLFIQQSVYILFYPLFYLFNLVFGYEGFVFFGRLLMAILSVGVFLYVYRKLLEVEFSSIVASVTALTLTFAIPYHGIFAPSYNTIAQILWIIFTIRYFEWKPDGAISMTIIPIVMAFAHPTSAVTITLLIFARLFIERDFKLVVRFTFIFLAIGLIISPVIFSFSSLHEYLTSFSFSSGYGVGSVFFASKKQQMTLIVIFALFGGCLLIGRGFHKVRFAFPVVFLIAVSIFLFKADLFQWGYSLRALRAFTYLSVLAYMWSLTNILDGDSKIRQRSSWLVVVILAYATTLGVTSGNGFGQATGAFMVGLPLFLAIAVDTHPTGNMILGRYSLFKIVCVSLVAILFVAHWSYYPYREVSWWQATSPIQSVPEFRFISTSSERATFIQRMQRDLGPVTKGKRTLLVSAYPGLYFVLGAQPETCMLYMHSLTSDKSENALTECMNDRNPEVIVDLFSDKDLANDKSRIKNVMFDFYSRRGFHCAVEKVSFESTTIYNPKYLHYTLCQ